MVVKGPIKVDDGSDCEEDDNGDEFEEDAKLMVVSVGNSVFSVDDWLIVGKDVK